MKTAFVWFDLGYTLVYRPREEAYRTALAELGAAVSLEDLEPGFHLVDKLFMREFPGVLGREPGSYMPWFLGLLNHRLGIRVDLCRAWSRLRELDGGAPHWMPFSCVAGALEGLRGRGLRLGVITNWDPSARVLLERLGLAGYFEHMIVSSEVGCEKPDPRIFEIALDRAGVSAGRSVYVGDNYYDDSVGARRVGMGCLVVNRFGSLGIEEISDCTVIADISQVADHLE